MHWMRIFFVFFFFGNTVHGYISPVKVSIDNQDSGFFLRFPNAAEDKNLPEGSTVQRFSLLDPSGSITVRASYGPFSVKQTVFPAVVWNTTREEGDNSYNILPTLDRDLDIAAHLVTPDVRRDKPVLRVLFHGGHNSDAKMVQHEESRDFCVALYVRHRQENLMSVCSLGTNRDGVCLAQVTLPANWWPPAEGLPRGKQQKNWVRVEYAALQSHDMECSESSLPVTAPSGIHSTFLTDLTLSELHGSYEEIKSDELIRILVPQDPVYPKSKVYIPVYLLPNPAYPLYVFVIRARVKSGLRILGAQVAQPFKWQISLDLNAKQTLATVTAFVKNTLDSHGQEHPITDRAQEVFTWLFEVDEDADFHDDGHIVWQLRYALDSSMSEQYDFDESNPKMTSRLDIQKDDVQAVLPIAKSNQLMNMAVLTGKQVSQPMKVFVVSQAGKVGDVTLKSSCHSADESILKVSPSCTSVYLDGSEIRGSQNATVLVKYGTYIGQTHFLVWMAELPLDVRLSDNKLSQIKGWRTPHVQVRKSRTVSREYDGKKSWDSAEQMNLVCRLRYQQAKVEVYTKFVSVDHNSGREAYLLNRKAGFRITNLVAPFLRVADSRIASLKGSTVRGMEGGRTEVQVLSPITGRVNGAREVRVGSDKETITLLQVTIVTGLQLAVFPDMSIPQVFLAQSSITHKLTSQYQEGLLDIKLHFSDKTVIPLSEISENDYHLSVDTFDNSIIAFAPAISLHHPRVIAIGQGKGDLFVSVELADRCQKRRSQPLAMAYANVEVNFTEITRTTSLQNDARFKMGKAAFAGERQKITGSVLFRDSMNPETIHFHEPTIQHRQNPVMDNLTPLEIGMYSLLGVFCLAVFVFVISCTVFAVRYRKKLAPTMENTETVAHAHDWVWLGRATLERNSVNTRCSQTLVPTVDFNGNAHVDGSKTEPRTRHIDRKKKNRNSDGSFPGSEISIRITTNPQQRDDAVTRKPTNSSTFCREKGRLQKPGSSKFSTFSKPPPIPPHRTSPHNKLTVTDNPMSESEWEAVTRSMNYEQLVEYFVNLKESNA